MGKKRNRQQQQQQSGNSSNNQNNDNESTRYANNNNDKKSNQRFESFPLHLLPENLSSKQYNNNHNEYKIEVLHPGRVWVVPSFFTQKECQNWIDFCESSTRYLEYTAHPASKYIAHRECYRMNQNNAVELSRRIYQRLKASNILHRIQQDSIDLFPPNNNKVPIGCNPNLRVYKYEKGHSFGPHVDGSNVIGNDGGDMLCGRTTEMTMLIYLSNCRGGATRFHTTPTCRRSRTSSSSFAFEPQAGALLLHVHGEHCLEHEADPVMDGLKYVLRTDLVYGPST